MSMNDVSQFVRSIARSWHGRVGSRLRWLVRSCGVSPDDAPNSPLLHHEAPC